MHLRVNIILLNSSFMCSFYKIKSSVDTRLNFTTVLAAVSTYKVLLQGTHVDLMVSSGPRLFRVSLFILFLVCIWTFSCDIRTSSYYRWSPYLMQQYTITCIFLFTSLLWSRRSVTPIKEDWTTFLATLRVFLLNIRSLHNKGQDVLNFLRNGSIISLWKRGMDQNPFLYE